MKKNKTFETNTIVTWKKAWSIPAFRIQSIITLIVLASFSVIFNYFFDFVESRNGACLRDYLLEVLPGYNVSWVVFFFLYSGIVTGLYFHIKYPKTILVIFQTYVFVTLLRIGAITLVVLNPPDGYIPLKEPFVQLFTNGGRIISRDLFFSGHMSTILSLYFSSHIKPVSKYLLVCSFMIGLMVLIQHVHYTIDVIFAVPATFGVYFFCKKYLGGKVY